MCNWMHMYIVWCKKMKMKKRECLILAFYFLPSFECPPIVGCSSPCYSTRTFRARRIKIMLHQSFRRKEKEAELFTVILGPFSNVLSSPESNLSRTWQMCSNLCFAGVDYNFFLFLFFLFFWALACQIRTK